MEIFDNLHFDDPLFNFATVLTAGIIGGELFARIGLPKVTGWIATGILLRSLLLPGMNVSEDPAALDKFKPFMSFVLGYIAFTVGATLYFASLRNTGKRIGLLLLGEATITFSVIAAALYLIGPLISPSMNKEAAVLLAAIGIAAAPGTTVLVIQEARARGILTRTLIAAIGLIDMVAVGVFVFVSIALGDEQGWVHAFNAVGTQFLTTFMIGGSCSLIALALTRTIVSPAFLGPTMVAVILGSWGAASGFGTSGGILACTFAGIVVTNVRHDTVRSVEAYLHSIGGVLFALFYTLAGMRLDFGLIPKAAGLVFLYFVVRLAGKSISAYTAMTMAGMTDNVRKYLGIALLPHGGVAVGLILLIQGDPAFAGVEETVTTVGLAALAINQLLGPSATRIALTRVGEDHKDRPQLLDFLEEHRITTDLGGETREEIIRSLSSLLYSTSKLTVPEEDFVQRVIERDRSVTTCLGQGLMIPHAILDEGDDIKGVLGISRAGVDLNAPDGAPVHAVLLLATPESDRRRHLEVLAAFATSITRDVNFREQLYHARSPAHAYDILHHEDQEDLNYFLEDAATRAGLRDHQMT
tara:strand:- start:111092 stop:112843 length:1752 start_codon:yes stop_codon:yes gene_type:complete